MGMRTANMGKGHRQTLDPLSEKAVVNKLRRLLPAGPREVVERLQARGAQAWIVGGPVRDAFLGRVPNDWDIATDLVPARVAELFSNVVRAGEKHGTIMVLTPNGPVEVTTFRIEGPYLDGRRPSHVDFLGTIEGDLARRDFTINAMAVDLTAGVLVDLFDGQGDLRKRRMRCVGDAVVRFREDGLRTLRALRFAGVLGFSLERATAAAIPQALDIFEKVAWERKRDELAKLFGKSASLTPCVRGLVDSGLWGALAPEFADLRFRAVGRWDAMMGLALGPAVPWLRLAGVLATSLQASLACEDALARLLNQWRVSKVEGAQAVACVRAWRELKEIGPKPDGPHLRRWLATHRSVAPLAAKLSPLIWGQRYLGAEPMVKKTLGKKPPLTLGELALTGEDLMALGLKGPEVGAALRYALDAVLLEPRNNHKNVLIKLVEGLSTGSSTVLRGAAKI